MTWKKTGLVLITCLVAVLALAQAASDESWEKYKKRFNKTFENRNETEARIWFDWSVDAVNECNRLFRAKKLSFHCRLNSRADKPRAKIEDPVTHMEKVARLGVYEPTRADTQTLLKHMARLLRRTNRLKYSHNVDWSSRVGPIVEQGDCLSCYAFAVTNALESHYAIHKNEHFKLSDQQILDCTYYDRLLPLKQNTSYATGGCEGGFMDTPFEYAYATGHGFNYAEDYPYRGDHNQSCAYDPKKRHLVVPPYKAIPSLDEEEMRRVVEEKGPVIVGIDAKSKYFFNYADGVYDNPRCNTTVGGQNHAMLVVGYGTTKDGKDYWKLKNSWGTDWGVNGYGYIARNKNACGITYWAIYPDV